VFFGAYEGVKDCIDAPHLPLCGASRLNERRGVPNGPTRDKLGEFLHSLRLERRRIPRNKSFASYSPFPLKFSRETVSIAI
jgi:hypothetical protein